MLCWRSESDDDESGYPPPTGTVRLWPLAGAAALLLLALVLAIVPFELPEPARVEEPPAVRQRRRRAPLRLQLDVRPARPFGIDGES